MATWALPTGSDGPDTNAIPFYPPGALASIPSGSYPSNGVPPPPMPFGSSNGDLEDSDSSDDDGEESSARRQDKEALTIYIKARVIIVIRRVRKLKTCILRSIKHLHLTNDSV